MNTLHKCLENLLLKDKFEVGEIANAGQATLGEKVTEMEVSLTELPANAIVIKCPPNQDGYFNSACGYTKICDYIVLNHISKQDVMQVLFIELKKTVRNCNGCLKKRCGLCNAKQQIKSTVPLLYYIIAGLKIHFKEKLQLAKTIKERHYLIWAARKSPTRGRTYPELNRSKSGEFLIMDKPSLEFSEIVDAS